MNWTLFPHLRKARDDVEFWKDSHASAVDIIGCSHPAWAHGTWGCTLTACLCQFTPWSPGMRPSKVTPADDNDATAVLPRAESSGVHCSPVLTGPAERSSQ